MVTALVAFAALAQAAQDRPQPGPLISKMLAKYNAAQTLTGDLQFTQSAMNMSLKGTTAFQFEKPSKLYVSQTIDKSSARIVSNGNRFLYSIPQESKRTLLLGSGFDTNQVLVENVSQWDDSVGQDVALDISRLYEIGCSGLVIKPEPILLALGSHDDLQRFSDRLVNATDQGDATINGKKAYLIGGDLREYAAAPPDAQYQMAITYDGDLLRWTEISKIADPRGSGYAPIVVTSVWDVAFKAGAQVNEALFKDKLLGSS